MASFSNYAEDEILDHALSDGAWSEPSALYVALCTVVPTDSSTGSTLTEANYTGYARKEVLATDLSASSGGSKTNSSAITFDACTAGSSTVIGFALVDASSNGNVIMWGTVTSKVIDTSNTPATIAIGALVATLD